MAKGEAVNSVYERGSHEVQRRGERAEKTGEIVDLFSAWQLQTMIAHSNELESVVAQVHDAMSKIPLAEDPDELVLKNCGVHVVRRSLALVHRSKFVSLLVRLAYDERFQAGDRSHLRKALESEEPIFSSSEALGQGVILLDAYLAPLYGALTPAVWCLGIHRELGTIIYTLGQPLAGTRGEAAELLQLLPHHSPTEQIKIPAVPPKASGAAVDWWVDRLNKLFAVVADPAVFADKSGVFQPTSNLRALLSLEQVFRRVSSIQLAHRDIHAQRVLLFTVLDTLEHLTGRNLETHCTLRMAQKTLDALRVDIPHDAAEVLLPAAERAVAALAAVQDGFFLQRQMEIEGVGIPLGNGTVKRLSLEQAAAQYIKLLRDATHGHGTNRADLVERVNALLAHHSGDLPFDLPLLGYLYLLDVLVRPDVLRRKLSHHAAK